VNVIPRPWSSRVHQIAIHGFLAVPGQASRFQPIGEQGMSSAVLERRYPCPADPSIGVSV